MIYFLGVLIYLCVFQLFTTSNSFQIDYAKLRVRNSYTQIEDAFPQDISDTMTLLRNNNIQNLPFDFSGEYHRNSIDDAYDTKVDFIWEKIEFDGDTSLQICFYDHGLCTIKLPDEDKQAYYSYNDGKILFRDKYFNTDLYSCEFIYTKVEDQIDLLQFVGALFSSDFQTSDPISAPTLDTTNDTNNGLRIDIYIPVELQKFFKDVIIPWEWEIFVTGVIFVISFIFLSSSASRLLKKTYKRRLLNSLFPKEHSWFGNNSPDDIYVSVKVFLQKGAREYNLLDYFSSAISNKESSVHVILGTAGSGKTFSLSRIALGILKGFNFSKKNGKIAFKKFKKLIPVILNCSEMAECKNDDDIIDSIYDKICFVAQKKRRRFSSSAKSSIKKTIMSYLSSGKFVLLIDGYDEITDIDTRLIFSYVLIKFMEEYKKCNYILTSRTQIYEEECFYNIPPEKTLYLSPLSKEQIHTFLSKWSFPKNKSGTELYRRIISTVQLESVVTNPLLLTMVVHTYSKSDFLFSGGRLTLYQQCCECLLKNWEVNKSLRKRLKRYTTLDNTELKMELLAVFAYYLYENGGSYIKEDELLKLWNDHSSSSIYFQGRTKDVLDDIINQSGLIENTSNGGLRFRHRSFFEYFVAIYMIKFKVLLNINNIDIHNESNILFFYLSMIDDESIVIEFITKNTKYAKLIQDILIERKIEDTCLIYNFTDIIVKTINFEDITQILSLGYMAQQYIEIRPTVKNVLTDVLYNCTSEQVKINTIIGLMLFCDKDYLCILLRDIDDINLYSLVQYAGDSLDDLAKEVMDLINDDQKIQFIELLAKTCRFEAICNIYNHDKKDIKDYAVIGFLYMAQEAPLLELLELLDNKKFYERASYECQKASKYLQNKYGWIENLSPDLTKNLFLLIYLSKQIIKDGFKPKKNLIKNQIAFLLSYIISEEDNILRNDLIDIQGFEVKSTSEFLYHWNKRKHNNSRNRFAGVVSIPALDFAITLVVFGMIFFQAIFYLIIYTEFNNIFNQGWDIQLDTLYSFSFLPPNSCYIVFVLDLFIFDRAIYSVLRKVDYGTFSVLLFITWALTLSFIYELFVQNFVFRIIAIISIIFVGILESVKHRNDYPSLKEPQHTELIKFLAR